LTSDDRRAEGGSSSATTLLLVRHGETAWNAEGRIQGQLDIPLSARGMWQAARLAERLMCERVDAVVSSDLARAALTAQPVASALGLPTQFEPRLRERHFGRFQGHTLDEISAAWPEQFHRWRERDPSWAIPDGESGQQFIARVIEALGELAAIHRGGTVAVFAHGGTLDIAYRHARAMRWDAPREHLMLNASINRMRAQQVDEATLRLTIDLWGDVAHLDSARDELAGA
jgi:probable phosphoglycerate mutase